MLMVKVLLWLGEPNAREAGLEERLVVAASEESIRFVNERHLHICDMCSAGIDLLNESPQMAGWCVILIASGYDLGNNVSWQGQVIRAGAKDANSVLVQRIKWRVGAATDDVVVEIALYIDGSILDCAVLDGAIQERVHLRV